MIRFVAIFGMTVTMLCAVYSVEAAVYTVTKITDTNDGTCDADCSLREAIAAANGAASDDVVEFDETIFGSAQNIVLSLGEMVIVGNGSLTINGTGANLLTIDGNLTSRIFKTVAGVVAEINDLKLTRGNGVGSGGNNTGGAIYNELGTLILNNVIVTGNTVSVNAGGIRNSGSGSVLNINDCIISNNTAMTSSGGGIQNFSTSTVNINNSTFIGNTSGGTTGGGGGQFNGTVRITNSTFANNTAPSGSGGGMQSNGTNQIITNSTFSGNSSLNNGGGIHRGTTNVNFFIRNSIVAGNNGAAASPDITNSTNGINSEGNNIIGNVGTSTGWEGTDLINVNPMLGMLADNGGFGMTFLPMPGSPAINAGQNCVLDISCATSNPPQPVTTDQRGVMRPQGPTVDIGSVEVAVAQASATVSGRVVTSSGQGVSQSVVTISNAMGVVQTRLTSSFGYFDFSDIPTGQMYTIEVSSKRFDFDPQQVTVNGDVTGVVIVANDPTLSKPGSK
jgi:CSLREA domain-containing protein